jgi:hypothetical protein
MRGAFDFQMYMIEPYAVIAKVRGIKNEGGSK